jgi:hypothetical protein
VLQCRAGIVLTIELNKKRKTIGFVMDSSYSHNSENVATIKWFINKWFEFMPQLKKASSRNTAGAFAVVREKIKKGNSDC